MEHVVYLTGDRNPKRESTDRKLDLTELSLESNQFDVLLCNHVLEHIHDDAAAIREIYRVCKPGGQAVITVPTRPGITDYDPTVRNPDERKKRFGQADHVRYYGRDSLPITLGVPGFVVDVVDMHIVMSDEERARHSTRGERQIYWCRKGL
jgi:SAM-dependent methyltransferase